MLGEAVKSLWVWFRSKGYEEVKYEIDSIPDEKTVKIEYDPSGFRAALADLATLARNMDTLERSLGGGDSSSGGGFWGNFFKRLAFQGFSSIGPVPAFFTSIPGLILATGAIATAASELTALAGGFAAAGAGAVAFGLLAKPTFSAVSGAVTALATDTAAYQAATTATAKSDALAKIKADWAALDPAQKQAVKQVQAFQNAWAEAAQAFEPQAMKIFNDVLAIANRALPALRPLATAFSTALDPLLKKLDTFLGSKGFQGWLSKFTSLIGPAVSAFGNGIGRMINDIGKLLTTFSPKDVAHAINIAFDVIDAAIRAFTWIVNSARTAWDWIARVGAPAVEHAFDNVQHAVGNTKHAWDNVSHAIDNVHHAFDNAGHAIGNIIHVFDNVGHALGNFNHAIDNTRHFVAVAVQGIWNTISTILNPGRLAAFLVNSGRAIISGLIAGIKSMIGPLQGILSWVTSLIPSWKGPLDKDRQLLVPNGQAIMQGLLAGISSQVPALHGQLTGITRGIGSYGPRGYGGGGQVVINFNGIVGDPHKTAMEIQQMLLQLKRRRFGSTTINTGQGLGLA